MTHIISLPPDATDADFIALVRRWIDFMSAGDFVAAMNLLRPDENKFWTPEQVKSYLEEYQSLNDKTNSSVTSVSQMKEDKSRAHIYWSKLKEPLNQRVVTIEHDLALGEEWSDLTAQFQVWKTPEGLQISLEDIHVM